MSNLETTPVEVVCEARVARESDIEILEPRVVPLGGPRALAVNRTLPQRARSLIGGWCFIDHYGPNEVTDGHGMVVPPHPHTGLQTVSWLFSGEVEHRDSTGAHALVRPGELNLMTAGRGIQHSEVSTASTRVLHGAQLWIALPEASRHIEPFFERFVPEPANIDGAMARVFLGSLAGHASTATTFSPLVGAQLDLPAASTVTIPVDARFEHGVLLDAGALSVEGTPVGHGHVAYAAPGRSTIALSTGNEPARVLLIGGEPLRESIVMWWNFIGRSHDEIVAFRNLWQAEVIADENRSGHYGHVDGYDGSPLPAPELPIVRLKPRG